MARSALDTLLRSQDNDVPCGRLRNAGGGYWRMYRVGRFSPYGSLLCEPNSLGADKHLPNYALPETGLAS